MRIYPKLVTPECFYRGSSHGFLWIPMEASGNDRFLEGLRTAFGVAIHLLLKSDQTVSGATTQPKQSVLGSCSYRLPSKNTLNMLTQIVAISGKLRKSEIIAMSSHPDKADCFMKVFL